jgi:4-hydroxythreonine-4-phosphate dehydrogenase
LETGIGLSRTQMVRALVTGPISKHQLHQVGFTHPGQTEFIAERCGIQADNAVMMLAAPTLRVVPLTIHIAIVDVPAALTTDLIVARGRIAARGLTRNFGIAAPRIAIAGLNPHAGESGDIGDEEARIIAPAIAILRDEGIDITGPIAADTMFVDSVRSRYDALLCAYHDQALAPFKALHFHDGVNITLGLPIVRTSADHGTAFGMAGQNGADPRPTIAALRMAAAAADHREADANA